MREHGAAVRQKSCALRPEPSSSPAAKELENWPGDLSLAIGVEEVVNGAQCRAGKPKPEDSRAFTAVSDRCSVGRNYGLCWHEKAHLLCLFLKEGAIIDTGMKGATNRALDWCSMTGEVSAGKKKPKQTPDSRGVQFSPTRYL